ncbi:MAG: hypothetical protein IKB04_05400 [Clostridia bacterium]|nr:hypothetical protein [Clostridia bacterium]
MKNYAKRRSFDRLVAIALAILLVIAMIPANVFASTSTDYGTVTTFTGGTVADEDPSKVSVLVEETTLQWVDADAGLNRAAGWWVGIKMTAPTEIADNAGFRIKKGLDAEYGTPYDFSDTADGDGSYVELWFPVSPEDLETFAAQGLKPTRVYEFDWDGDAVYEQEVTFAVTPSEKIVLMKDGVQVYPLEDSVSVEGYTGVYDGEAHTALVTAEGYTVKYSENNIDFTETPVSITDVGEKTVYVQLSKAGYVALTKEVKLSVTLAEITGISIEKTINKYTGEKFPVAILKGTLLPDDKVTYTITGDENEYSAIPKFAEVRSYEVTITVDRGDNYRPYVQTVTSEIALGELVLGSLKVEGLEGIYTGNPQKVVTVSGNEGADYTIKYKLGVDGAWQEEIPTVVDAGSYTVFVKVTKANYEDKDVEVAPAQSAAVPFNVYIAKEEQTGFVFENATMPDLPYNSTVINQATGGQSTGEVTYEVTAGQEYVEVDENGNVKAIKAGGTATVTATRAGDNNYKAISTTYVINTIKADQTGFAFTQSEYSVQYGSKTTLTVTALGGQSGGTVTYEVVDGDIASINNTSGALTFNSGKTGPFTVKATLAGGNNYNDITAEATVKVNTNDFEDKYSVPDVPASGWYTIDVDITPAEGYKISNSDLFDATWMDKITIATEGKNTPAAIYLKHEETGYISEAVNVGEIWIDKTAPTELKIEYSQPIVEKIIEAVTFGFYKPSMEVTLTATDDISKLDKFSYKIGEDIEGEIAIEATDDATVSKTFTIPAELNQKAITFTATNKAGLSNVMVGDKVLVVDSLGPKIDIAYKPKDENTTVFFRNADSFVMDFNAATQAYYDGSVDAKISIEEVNFFEGYKYTDEQGAPIGKSVHEVGILVTKTDDQGKVTKIEYLPAEDAEQRFADVNETTVFEWKHEGDKHTLVIPLEDDADYVITVNYADFSTNDSTIKADDALEASTAQYTSKIITVDTVKPEISIEPANGAFYDKNKTVKVTVKEHNFVAELMNLEVTGFEYDKTTGDKVEITEFKQGETVLNYAEYLQKATWTEEATNVWVAEIPFETEANYSIKITGEDLAGNAQKDEVVDTFTVDETAPTDLSITYTPKFENVLWNAVTFGLGKVFGFYKDEVTVTLKATDTTSRLDTFTYKYTVDADAINSGNTGKDDTSVTVNGVTDEVVFTIPAQFRGKVSFVATDKSQNSTEFVDDDIDGVEKTIVVDNIAPEVSVKYTNEFYTNNVDNKLYLANHDTVATIVIEEANFFGAADLVEEKLKVYLTKVYDDETKNPETPTLLKDLTFNKVEGSADVYEAVLPTFNEDADYTLTIEYTDRSGNASSYKKEFTVDTTKPEISIEPANGAFYDKNKTVKVTVKEHNFNATLMNLEVTGFEYDKTTGDEVKITEFKQGETVLNYAEYLQEATWTEEATNVFVTEIPFETEANYSIKITGEDLAGNAQKDEVVDTFTVDKTAPLTGDLDIFVGDKSVKPEDLNEIAFNVFSQTTITVKLSAFDKTSGVASVKYQIVNHDEAFKLEENWVEYDAENGFRIEPNTRVIVYVRVEDKSTNTTIIHSRGIVVDDKAPDGSEEQQPPKITIAPQGANALGFNNSDVTVKLFVQDPKYVGATADLNGYYSGLKEISYQIVAADINAEYTAALMENAELQADVDGEVVRGEYDKLIHSWNGEIVIPASNFNSNHVCVTVTATDNAGNTTITTYKDIQIDITKPKINVSYDNNQADVGSVKYFKADRKATITITERNFNQEKVEIDITNTDGVIPAVVGWTKTEGTGNLDDTTWTATIDYVADGDYTFSVKYTDEAGNANEEVETGNSVQPYEFTIDKTLPVIVVTYDNNDVYNGKYYQRTRVATVTITEHNFAADRVTFDITAQDPLTTVAAPAPTAWVSNGDTHTATITYSADAEYTFDIAMKDLAGNDAADFAKQNFVVDNIDPALEITGVADKSANAGDVIPVVTYSDTNWDENNVTITLTGVNRKGVKISGKSVDDIRAGRTFGQTFTFDNFAEKKEIDDIYTLSVSLTDMAGRTTQKSILFSVNRFGSTYELSEDVQELLKQYYVKNVTSDVVIHEINTDVLTEYNVTLNGVELVKDTDYTVESTGGVGQWKRYTYTVKKELFEAEGEYILVVSSTDKAKNDAFSDVKDAAINFVVDRTPPVVTVSGITEDGRYQTDKQVVTLIPTDDGGALYSLLVYLVDEDGNKLKELVNLVDDKLADELTVGNGAITFTIDKGLYQNVRIECTDRASGNDGKANEYTVTIGNVSINSNAFIVQFWANKTLRWGVIGGVLLLTAAIIFFVIYKKRKKNA